MSFFTELQRRNVVRFGAPWELEVTPNFARMLEGNEVPWPPVSGRVYPLKDW